MAHPRYQPNDAHRAQVLAYATVGTPHHQIALLLGTRIQNLFKHYRAELDTGKARGVLAVAGQLYAGAMRGDKIRQMFFLKCQAGWRETTQTQQLGKDGKPIDPSPAVTIIAGPTDQAL